MHDRDLVIGGLIEITTLNGFAYALCTHIHEEFGHLIRVLRGVHSVRPTHLCELVGNGVLYSVFLAWGDDVDTNIVRSVAICDMPFDLSVFPHFRDGVIDPATGAVKTWWIWDGDQSWPVASLTENQKKLPIRAIWDEVTLASRIERIWTP